MDEFGIIWGEEGEFIPVAEAKTAGIIPEYYHKWFEDKCIYCEADMMIKRSCTEVFCDNIRCYRKIAGQCAKFISAVRIKNFGIQRCYTYIKQQKVTSIIDFVMEPPFELTGLREYVKRIRCTFPDAVRRLSLPELNEKAKILFAGVDSYAEFQELVAAAGSLEELCLARFPGTGREALEVFMTVKPFLYEISRLEELFTIQERKRHQITIAMTGPPARASAAVGKKLSKDDYVSLLNTILQETDFMVALSGAVMSVMYIIADAESNTAKYNAGLARGNLVASDRFLEVIHQLQARLRVDAERAAGQDGNGVSQSEVFGGDADGNE